MNRFATKVSKRSYTKKIQVSYIYSLLYFGSHTSTALISINLNNTSRYEKTEKNVWQFFQCRLSTQCSPHVNHISGVISSTCDVYAFVAFRTFGFVCGRTLAADVVTRLVADCQWLVIHSVVHSSALILCIADTSTGEGAGHVDIESHVTMAAYTVHSLERRRHDTRSSSTEKTPPHSSLSSSTSTAVWSPRGQSIDDRYRGRLTNRISKTLSSKSMFSVFFFFYPRDLNKSISTLSARSMWNGRNTYGSLLSAWRGFVDYW